MATDTSSIARRRLEALTASYDAQMLRPESRRPRAHVAERSWHVSAVHVRAAVSLAVAAGILMTWWVLAGRPRTSEPAPVQFTAHASSERSGKPAASQVVVDVTGKVRRPGIVTLRAGSRVNDALAKAGGVLPGADASGVNLARVLIDGEQIVVGVPPVVGAVGPTATGAVGAGGVKVGLNAATIDQLDTLPGIGPVTAQAIAEFRTANGGFRRIEDLLKVHGIGAKTLADLRDQVTL